MPTTLIRNAAWVVAWDAGRGRHAYRRDVDLAFAGDRIVHLGPGYAGTAETVIDGANRAVIPGLVNIHSHPEHEPLYRGIREEHGLPSMHMTGLYERSQALSAPDDEARAASAESAYCELLRSGVTTLVDVSPPWSGWVELFAQSGLRGFLAPGYASARWYMENDRELLYAWDEARGRDGFAAALDVIDKALAHSCGRLSGAVAPMQIDTCTPELLRDSHAAARERGLPFTVHVAQSVVEVREMIRRHGRTPIQWANALGLLGPGTILAHALYLDTHSWVRWHTKDDLKILGDTGTAVAHCPTPFARYGHVMEDFGAYLRAGVVMGLGTDCAPHNLAEEMRKAAVLARIASRDINAVTTSDLFHAATVKRRDGADARRYRPPRARHEGRSGVARSRSSADAAGARPAALVCLSRRRPRGLRRVRRWAAGRGRRRVLTLDEDGATARLRAAQQRMEALAPSRDYRGRSADEITPLSLPVLD